MKYEQQRRWRSANCSRGGWQFFCPPPLVNRHFCWAMQSSCCFALWQMRLSNIPTAFKHHIHAHPLLAHLQCCSPQNHSRMRMCRSSCRTRRASWPAGCQPHSAAPAPPHCPPCQRCLLCWRCCRAGRCLAAGLLPGHHHLCQQAALAALCGWQAPPQAQTWPTWVRRGANALLSQTEAKLPDTVITEDHPAALRRSQPHRKIKSTALSSLGAAKDCDQLHSTSGFLWL